MRYFLEISYDGTNYHGWQHQPNAISVQQTIEEALSTLLREKIAVVGAGRTDAGVHAKQLFAHADIDVGIDELCYRLNAFLPSDIAVGSIKQVSDQAHARFDATARTYEYWISRGKDPFLMKKAYEFTQALDIRAMNEAGDMLLRHHDFQCFSRSRTDVKTYHCNIEKAVWEQERERLVFTIKADRFLRNMVRAIVGTMLSVGQGKLSMNDFERIILSKDRKQAGASAPAHGLYLTKVDYPEDIFSNGRS